MSVLRQKRLLSGADSLGAEGRFFAVTLPKSGKNLAAREAFSPCGGSNEPLRKNRSVRCARAGALSLWLWIPCLRFVIQGGFAAAFLKAAAAGTLAICLAGLWRGLTQPSRLSKTPKCL